MYINGDSVLKSSPTFVDIEEIRELGGVWENSGLESDFWRFCYDTFGCGGWSIVYSETNVSYTDNGEVLAREIDGIEFRNEQDAFVFRLAWSKEK